MSGRIAINRVVEASVLTKSARRCALCFGLDGDLTRKKGQIAHIDKDPSNAREENLVYLCVEHHDEYDSTTRQSKGITADELRTYKQALTDAILRGDHRRQTGAISISETRSAAVRAHDEKLFSKADTIVPEWILNDFLDVLQSEDAFLRSRVDTLDKFRSMFTEASNQFMQPDVSAKVGKFIATLDTLLSFLARHFFIYPEKQPLSEDYMLCMHPDLNIDRGGPGTPESISRYSALQSELDDGANAVRDAYRDYRLAVKQYLCV